MILLHGRSLRERVRLGLRGGEIDNMVEDVERNGHQVRIYSTFDDLTYYHDKLRVYLERTG